MGAATLDLTLLDIGKATDLSLCLQDPSRPTSVLGEIILTVTLYPKTQEDKEQVIFYVMEQYKNDKLIFTLQKFLSCSCFLNKHYQVLPIIVSIYFLTSIYYFENSCFYFYHNLHMEMTTKYDSSVRCNSQHVINCK